MKQLVIAFIFLSFNSFCQEISFFRLTEEDGLPGGKPRCFHKSSDGFLWIGTSSGLCRYDGNEVVLFTQEQGYEFPNEDINAIVETQDGILWLGTNAGGLSSFDPKTEEITSFLHDPNDSESIAGDRIQSLELGGNGEIWIGFDNGIGLSRFDPSTKKAINYDPFSLVEVAGVKAIRSVVFDKWNKKRIWLGTTSGLILFDLITEEFTVINHPLTSINRHGLFALDQIDENRLIGGFFHAGVDVYSIDEGKWKGFYTDPSNVTRTYDLAKKSDTEYWVAARKRGLAIFNIESGNLEFISSDIDNQRTPFPDFTFSVYSEGGRVWVGSKHGVSYSQEGKNKLALHPLSFTSKEFGRVTDFSGKYDKIYIAGYHGLGLVEIDKASKEQRIHPLSSEILETMSGIHETKNGIYITTETKEMFFFDKNTYRTEAINIDAISDQAITMSLVDWTEEYGLILTRFGGIYKLHYASHEIEPLAKKELAEYWLHDALVLDDGDVWIGTNEAVYIYNPQSNAIKAYYPEIISSKQEKHVLAIKKDALGRIWMGTTHGLLKLEDGKETLYTVLNSDLAGNAVSQIAFDKESDIWVTTQKGVTHIDHNSMQMTSFDKQDGIDTEGILEAIDGEIYYGDAKGYYVLSSLLDSESASTIQTHITDFQVNNEPYDLPIEINFTDKVELEYFENSIAFSYSAPIFTQPQRLIFVYRLVGFDDNWTETSNRRFANFTNLDGGDYVFEVKAKTRDTEWSDPKMISIYIATPFWEAWWFYLICALLFLLIVFSLYKIRVKMLQRKAETEAQELRLEALQKRLSDVNATPPDLHLDVDELNSKLQTPLSEREFETLKLSLDGKSNAEIGEALFISVSTVKFHLTNIYGKLGVSNRKEALDYVVQKS